MNAEQGLEFSRTVSNNCQLCTGYLIAKWVKKF